MKEVMIILFIGVLIFIGYRAYKRGPELIETARLKAEISKIEKISTAVSVYYSKYDSMPGVEENVVSGGVTYDKQSSGAVWHTLIDKGLLKEDDFKSNFGSVHWIFVGCKHDDSGRLNTWEVDNIDEITNLCIYRSSNPPSTFKTATSTLVNPLISNFDICLIETLLDDKNLYSGDGRLAYGYNLTSDISMYCSSDSTDYKDIQYLYRVF